MMLLSSSTSLVILLPLLLPTASAFVVTAGASHSIGSLSATPVNVALTREAGRNDKLRKRLSSVNEESNMVLVERPCIAHAAGPDEARLSHTMLFQEPWSYVIITSPEAARVAMREVDKSGFGRTFWPPVAAVGKATAEVLQGAPARVGFTPSRANAATLAAELPQQEWSNKVLYPASCRAATTLEEGLEARGFSVTRLNTYDTVPAVWETTRDSEVIDVACFASPSAVTGWIGNTREDDPRQARHVYAACIGGTTAAACREAGWPEERIFCPENPGLDGWVSVTQNACAAFAATRKEVDVS